MEEQKATNAIPTLEVDENSTARRSSTSAAKIVRKDLTAMMKRGANVPTFVLEYLLGMYCSTDDDEMVEQGVKRIRKDPHRQLRAPRRKRDDRVQDQGAGPVHHHRQGARPARRVPGHLRGRLHQPEHRAVRDAARVRARLLKILQGGIWCILRIEYLQPDDENGGDALADIFDEKPKSNPKKKGKSRGPEDSPFHVVSLKPIQMPNLDLDAMIALRREFTTKEWMDLCCGAAATVPTRSPTSRSCISSRAWCPWPSTTSTCARLGPRGTGKKPRV